MNQPRPPHVTKRKTMNETIQFLLNEAPNHVHEICAGVMFLGAVVLLVMDYFDKLNL